jgi:hypothetical protein
MNIAPLRAARTTGLLLIALSALSSPAAAMGPAPVAQPAAVATAGGISNSSVSDVQCPCNPDLPVRHAASVSSAAAYSDPIRSGGFQLGVASAPAIQTSGTFDWADASVGAGVTAGIGLFLAGGALMFGRRRVHEQLRAS